jgi:sarcosine/dimethylglycine N-methyltransferase
MAVRSSEALLNAYTLSTGACIRTAVCDLSEWLGGLEQPLHFPVPWAEDAATSFVRPAEEIRALLATTGFREQKWVEWTKEWLAPRESGQRAVNPNIFMRQRGPEARRIGETILRNVREGRLITIKALLERP